MISRRKAARIAPYAIVLGIALLLYRSASGIDYFAPAGRIGPDFWPKVVLILMIVTCVYAIVRIGLFSKDESVSGVLQTLSAGPPTAESQLPPASLGPAGDRTYLVRLVLGIGATLLYAAVVPVTGFFLTTFAYLVAFMALGRYRRMVMAAAVSLAGTLLLLYFFMKVAYISLPIGVAPFSAVSLFLMQVMGVK
jgi:putative tricarboxylic transport membrane protein